MCTMRETQTWKAGGQQTEMYEHTYFKMRCHITKAQPLHTTTRTFTECNMFMKSTGMQNGISNRQNADNIIIHINISADIFAHTYVSPSRMNVYILYIIAIIYIIYLLQIL